MSTSILLLYGPEGPTQGRLDAEVGVEFGIALPEVVDHGYRRAQLIHKTRIPPWSEQPNYTFPP
jgi:hypothetical protein